MLTFFAPKISGFGLDLSDLSIKIIHLKRQGGKFSLASFGREEIPPGLIEGGEVKKESELIEIIRKAVKEVKGGKLNTRHCIVSLPETESFVRMLQLPLMKKEEVARAIKWELEAHIPLATEEIYYDWQIIECSDPNKKQIDVLAGVLPKNTVDPYLSVLKKAGLKPFIFEIESVATARALIKKGVSQKSILIIDLGAKRTGLLIYSGKTIYFTTSIPVCNNSLIQTLSQGLEVPEAKAREIKLKVGLDIKHPDGKIFESLNPPLMEMAGKIKIAMDFYHEHCLSMQTAGDKISKILLCGGGAMMLGLPEFLSSEINLPVNVGNPWVNVFPNMEDEILAPPFNESPAYATAIGLALRNWEE